MKRALAVVGSNWGDEGKGLVTDYLCASQDVGIVVRYNGGAQAGHTVVTPDGHRHVFSHFGSGSLCGVPTYLSEYFVCNPIQFFKERDDLYKLGLSPTIYAHPSCLVTTFADMMINQAKENARGDKRHGSTGLGINETINRSQIPELKITMADLWNDSPSLSKRMEEICGKYATFRIGKPLEVPGGVEAFIKGCRAFAEAVHPLGIAQCENPVFEGAQGLMLDQNNHADFPHLTRSNTGLQNVAALCGQAGIDDLQVYYVSRTYLTRHGAGPLPGEDPKMRYRDDTNVDHPFQGRIRFAPLDYGALKKRTIADFEKHHPSKSRQAAFMNLVLTHCDQVPAADEANLYFFGPTRDHVELTR